MNLRTLAQSIDAPTARAFVTAASHVVDALLIESQRITQAATPGQRDYETAGLSRETPPGGWISHDELRGVCQKMTEAIALERWVDGVVFAVQALTALGAL